MADNVTYQTTVATPPADLKVAAREATFGGDTSVAQVIVPVAVTGSEGAYTVREVLVADDAAFTPGTNAVLMVGAEYDDTSPDSVDEGDAGAIRMSARRELYVQLRDAAGNERGLNVDASGNITVNVTGNVAVTNAGLTELAAAINASSQMDVNIAASNATVTVSGTVDLGATDNAVLDNIDADLTTIIGHVDGLEGLLTTIDADTGNIVTAVQLIDDAIYVDDADWTNDSSKHMLVGGLYQSSPQTVTDGDVAPFNITANGALHVAVQNTVTVASHAVTNAGTFAVQVDGAALTALQLIDNIVEVEDTAHSTGDSGVMALAVRTDTPNAARADTDLDYIPFAAYRTGAIRTAIPEEDFAALGSNHVKKYYSNTGAVTDGIVWSPAAGKRWYVTDLILTTSSAATVTFEDDLAGGDSTVLALDLAANSGIAHRFATPLFSGEDAADLIVTTTAGNIKITVVGYEI